MKEMAALKVSELIQLLNQHLEKHGDTNVVILDERTTWYKTISKKQVHVGPEHNFVIVSEDFGDDDDY